MKRRVPLFLALWTGALLFLGANPGPSSSEPSEKESKAWSKIEKASELDKKAELAGKFLKTFPDSTRIPYVHDLLARFSIQKGDMDRFVAHAENSLKGVPENASLLIVLAVEYAERAKIDKAVDRAESGLKILRPMFAPPGASPRSWAEEKDQLLAEAHYALGFAGLHRYMQAKRGGGKGHQAELHQAQEHLQQAVRLDPEHNRAYYRLGSVCGLQNKLEETVDSYARSSALDGATSAASRQKLQMLHDRGFLKEDVDQLIAKQRGYVEQQIRDREIQLRELTDKIEQDKQFKRLLRRSGRSNDEKVVPIANPSPRGRSGAGRTMPLSSELLIRGLREELNSVDSDRPHGIDSELVPEVREKLALLKPQSGRVKQELEALTRWVQIGKSDQAARRRCRQQLKVLGHLARDLHQVLARMFPDLEGESGFKPEIDKSAIDTGFAKEMRFIEEQLAKVEQQIVEFVFTISQSVSVQELRDNMLIQLDRVKKMADKMRKEL